MATPTTEKGHEMSSAGVPSETDHARRIRHAQHSEVVNQIRKFRSRRTEESITCAKLAMCILASQSDEAVLGTKSFRGLRPLLKNDYARFTSDLRRGLPPQPGLEGKYPVAGDQLALLQQLLTEAGLKLAPQPGTDLLNRLWDHRFLDPEQDEREKAACVWRRLGEEWSPRPRQLEENADWQEAAEDDKKIAEHVRERGDPSLKYPPSVNLGGGAQPAPTPPVVRKRVSTVTQTPQANRKKDAATQHPPLVELRTASLLCPIPVYPADSEATVKTAGVFVHVISVPQRQPQFAVVVGGQPRDSLRLQQRARECAFDRVEPAAVVARGGVKVLVTLGAHRRDVMRWNKLTGDLARFFPDTDQVICGTDMVVPPPPFLPQPLYGVLSRTQLKELCAVAFEGLKDRHQDKEDVLAWLWQNGFHPQNRPSVVAGEGGFFTMQDVLLASHAERQALLQMGAIPKPDGQGCYRVHRYLGGKLPRQRAKARRRQR